MLGFGTGTRDYPGELTSGDLHQRLREPLFLQQLDLDQYVAIGFLAAFAQQVGGSLMASRGSPF